MLTNGQAKNRRILLTILGSLDPETYRTLSVKLYCECRASNCLYQIDTTPAEYSRRTDKNQYFVSDRHKK